MAAYFGASGLTDAFLVAYRIPNLLRDLLAEGAFSSAFVPTFTEANLEGQQKGRQLLWELFLLLGGITATLSLLIFIFAPELIALFAPAFRADPAKFELTVRLTRVMSPFLFFISLAALFMGALNSLRVFFVPALAPASYNVMSILCMVGLSAWLVSRGENPVMSLGWGALLGGAMQAAVQLPLLLRRGYGPVRPEKIGSPRARKVIGLLGPGLIGFAATQVNLLVNTVLATSAAVGATSWLNYAFRLFQLPVGILSVSIGNSNLVHFSESWKKGDRPGAIASLASSYHLSFFAVLPAMALLYCLSDEMVHLVFERGRFTRESTEMTALAVRMYTLGLPLYSLYKIWVPVFYAIDRQRVPVMSSLTGILINIGFCWWMTPRYGFAMLALGSTLSMLANCLLLSWVLRRDLALGRNFFFNAAIGKLVLASVAMGLATEGLATQLSVFEGILAMKAFRLALICSLSGMVFLAVLWIFGERELLLAVVRQVRSRLKKA